MTRCYSYRQEWYWDYQVNYAEGAARTMFPGRVARVRTHFVRMRTHSCSVCLISAAHGCRLTTCSVTFGSTQGVFTVFQMLRESVMCEVDRLKPKRIVVTGKQAPHVRRSVPSLTTRVF